MDSYDEKNMVRAANVQVGGKGGKRKKKINKGKEKSQRVGGRGRRDNK